ncbi:MAG: PAS domain S-box protein, partial [Mariprofundus sp.]|nr:PAS domain S-box protein [Mariprofundus sp.]
MNKKSKKMISSKPSSLSTDTFTEALLPTADPLMRTHEFELQNKINISKQAEEELHLATYVLDNAPVHITYFDSDAHIIYINKMGAKTLGYSRQALLKMSLADINPLFSMGEWRKFWSGLSLHKRAPFKTINQDKEGKRFAIKVMATYLEYRHTSYCVTFDWDITKRKITESGLKQSNLAQRVVSHILRIALKPITIKKTMNKSLQTILSGINKSSFTSASFFIINNNQKLKLLCSSTPIKEQLKASIKAYISDKLTLLHKKNSDKSHKQIYIYHDKGEEGGFLCIMIQSADQILGVLIMHFKQGYELSQYQGQFFHIIAETIALVIRTKQVEKTRKKLYKKNQLMARELLCSQEQERRRIARELHDEVGQ